MRQCCRKTKPTFHPAQEVEAADLPLTLSHTMKATSWGHATIVVKKPICTKLSFKLPRASAKGGRQLAPLLPTHHPYQMNNSMAYNINTVLRIT